MDNGEDAAAVARCLTGERNAYEGIVARYQRVLFNVALRMLGNYEEARDVRASGQLQSRSTVLQLDLSNSEERVLERPPLAAADDRGLRRVPRAER